MKKDQKNLLIAASEIIYADPSVDMECIVEEAARLVGLVDGLHLDDEEKEELVLRVSCGLFGARRMSPRKAVEAALYLYDLVEKEEL